MTPEGLPMPERPGSAALDASDGEASRDVDPASTTPDAAALAADRSALQILTTEHWSLLTARSLVYNEAFSRAGMFLTFLSASLVALALAAQALGFGAEFMILGAGVISVDIVIGLATWARVLDAAVDDLRAIHGMNRLRAGYALISSRILPFLVTSTHDDAPGVFGIYGSRGVRPGGQAFLHGLSTTSGMIGAIVALLTGALTAIVALLLGVPGLLALAFAALVLALVLVELSRRAQRRIARYHESIVSRFPSPAEP
jgi:hypothetical protein